MKKSLIHLAVLAALGAGASFSGRARTLDVAYTFRMGAGFPGDVNRTHPASIVAANMHTTQPVRAYGHAGLYDAATGTVRGFQAGDTALTKLNGVLVRPFPTQNTSGSLTSQPIGSATPPTGPAIVDVLEDGFIYVKVDNIAAGAPTKGGAVWVWCAASAGNDVQGGFRCAVSAGNTAAISNARWTGPADANGVAELQVWAA